VIRTRPARAEFEKVTAAPHASFTVRRVEGRQFAAPYHYHPEMELTWILRSSGHRFVGDSVETFGPGNLVLLGSRLPHVWLNHAGCSRAEALVVQFLPDFLGDDFFEVPEMRAVKRLMERSARGISFSTTARRNVQPLLEELEDGAGAVRLIALVKALVTLAADEELRILCSARYAAQNETGSNEKVSAVYRYVTARFRETIFQADMARMIGLSPAAFSRFFRSATGRCFTQMLIDVRLGYACELLGETDQTIAEVCFASGFESLANFNRQFRRRHGLSPREWRRAATDIGSLATRLQLR
jgi:AraC-like DNA-binding protein